MLNQVNEFGFKAALAHINNVVIKSSLVGHARITSYLTRDSITKQNVVIALIREASGLKSFYINQ